MRHTMFFGALACSLLMALSAALGGAGCASNKSGCASDKDCAEGRICKMGVCTDTNVGGSPATPGCKASGKACAVNGDCCNYQEGTGYCVNDKCADSCSTNSGCLSDCCAVTNAGDYVCSPADLCSGVCTTNGSACTMNGDCCTYLNGTGYCVDSSCADSCTDNYQCLSGCCATLTTGGGACQAAIMCG